MRIFLPAAATLIFCMSASAQSYSHEPDTYRHGGTYSTIQSSSEQACAEICRADTKCLVWSFRKPQTAAGPSQCELKQSIGQAEENPLMTSGVSPRFSEQQQAVVAPPTTDLLGGTQARTFPARTRAARTIASAPASYVSRPQAAAPTTQLHESAFGTAPTRRARVTAPQPTGRVLSPNDPRIIRNHTGQTSVTVNGTGQAQQTRIPVRAAQAQPAPQPTRAPTRPYDNLRNREFPRYSVQDGVTLDADTAEDAAQTAGAGS